MAHEHLVFIRPAGVGITAVEFRYGDAKVIRQAPDIVRVEKNLEAPAAFSTTKTGERPGEFAGFGHEGIVAVIGNGEGGTSNRAKNKNTDERTQGPFGRARG
jgi:hypothetical protein